jgi:hypothetical protein
VAAKLKPFGYFGPYQLADFFESPGSSLSKFQEFPKWLVDLEELKAVGFQAWA